MQYAAIVVLAVGIASGCNGISIIAAAGIPGSGIAKEETRAVDAFHAIDAGSAIQATVTVTPGSKPSLKISGDDNLVPLIESIVRDGKLILRVKENTSIRTKLPLVAEVVVSELDRLQASGASAITVKGVVKTDELTAAASGAARVVVEKIESSRAVVSATGASHVEVSGSAAALKADASGASEVKADSLEAENAEVSISGASGIAVRAKTSVSGDVSGASHLDLYGRPARKAVSTSGASQINENK